MASGKTIVVDYGLCNTNSMVRALQECGAAHVERTRNPHDIAVADRIVLPGVGSFAAAMRNILDWGLLEAVSERIERGAPFLGACLGMQLMASRGSEGSGDADVQGLGFVEGEVVRLETRSAEERIPHVGWNEVCAEDNAVLFAGLPSNADFYFVHSYHLRPARRCEQIGESTYCGGFAAAIQVHQKPIFGVQFHPEKSQANGFRLLSNFLDI